MAEQVGRAPEQVDCPDPLPVEAGAEVRCTLTDGGVTVGITATSNGESADGMNMVDITVDDQPMG